MKFINHQNNKIRVDKFLATQITNYSRNFLQNIIKNHGITVNKEIIFDIDYSLELEDIIEVKDIYFSKSSNKTNLIQNNSEEKLEILYENQNYAIINKPHNIIVHPGAGNHNNTIMNSLYTKFSNLSDIRGKERIGIVHRLDKDTTGCLMIAKNNQYHAILGDMIKNKTITRKYICLCHGTPLPHAGRIVTHIDKDKKHFGRMCVAESGKIAITNYKVIQILNNLSLIECILETGRTHQIRLHMQHIQHPIIGDQTYKADIFNKYIPTKDQLHLIQNIKRQMLHAYNISFIDPLSQEKIDIYAPLPQDMEEVIKKLGFNFQYLPLQSVE